GKIVFSWNSTDDNTGVGTLVAWTSAGGPRSIATTSFTGYGTASTDAMYILYTAQASSNGSLADVVLAKADGSSPLTVATQQMTDPNVCPPSFVFSGHYALALSCAPAGDAGTGGADLYVVDLSQGTLAATKLSNPDGWTPGFVTSDTAGTHVALITTM